MKTQLNNHGLGYEDETTLTMKNLYTLNGNFIKEGNSFPSCRFREMWENEKGEFLPHMEIYFYEKLTLEEAPKTDLKEVD